MQQAAQPDPQAQQMAMEHSNYSLPYSRVRLQSMLGLIIQARAGKLAVEAQLAPEEIEIEKIEAVTRNLKEGDQDDKEFERRLKVANTLLKKKS